MLRHFRQYALHKKNHQYIEINTQMKRTTKQGIELKYKSLLGVIKYQNCVICKESFDADALQEEKSASDTFIKIVYSISLSSFSCGITDLRLLVYFFP